MQRMFSVNEAEPVTPMFARLPHRSLCIFSATACYSPSARQWVRDFVRFVYVSRDFGRYLLLVRRAFAARNISNEKRYTFSVRHGRMSVWLLFESWWKRDDRWMSARWDEMWWVCVSVYVAHHRNRSRMRKNYNNNSSSERSLKRKKKCHKSHAQQFCTYSGRYMYDEMGITTRTNQRAFFFLFLRWLVRSFTYRHRFGSALWLTPVEFRSENINQQEVKSDQRQKQKKKLYNICTMVEFFFSFRFYFRYFGCWTILCGIKLFLFFACCCWNFAFFSTSLFHFRFGFSLPPPVAGSEHSDGCVNSPQLHILEHRHLRSRCSIVVLVDSSVHVQRVKCEL